MDLLIGALGWIGSLVIFLVLLVILTVEAMIVLLPSGRYVFSRTRPDGQVNEYFVLKIIRKGAATQRRTRNGQ